MAQDDKMASKEAPNQNDSIMQQEVQKRAEAAPRMANANVTKVEDEQKPLKEEHFLKLENLLLKRQLIEQEIKVAQKSVSQLDAEAKLFVDSVKPEYFPESEQIEINMATRAVFGRDIPKKEKK